MKGEAANGWGLVMVMHVNGSCVNGYKMTDLEFNRLLQHERVNSEELTWCEGCELASKGRGGATDSEGGGGGGVASNSEAQADDQNSKFDTF